MRLTRRFWLVLSAIALLACGSGDGDSPQNNPQGAGGTSSTGGAGGAGGSDVVPNCEPRCEARAITCGLPSNDASKLCSSLCIKLTSTQLNCLEKSTCDDLNSGAALSACGISGGAGQGGSEQGGAGQGGSGTSGQGGESSGNGGSSSGTEDTAALCSDGQDNDGDNFIDCEDKSCCALVDCKTTAPNSYCGKQGSGGATGTEDTVALCSDGQDNDGDNFIDCEDKDCCALVDCSGQPSSYCGKQGSGGSGGVGGTNVGGSEQGGAGQGGAGQGGSSSGGAGQGGSGGSGQAGSGGSVQPGDPQKILLTGTVLGPSGPFAGQVLVEGEKITCVEPGETCAGTAGGTGATKITTDGIISPGLIDMHNHILFDIFDNDDWTPEKAYTNHNLWTKEVRYGAMLDVKQCFEDASQGKPTWCPAKWDGTDNNLKCEMNKWGEVKGLLSGTTSIVGLIGNINACVGSLARSIGTNYDDLPGDTIQSSALVPSSGTSASNVCKNFASGTTKAYVIHAGEGTDATAKGEFEKLRNLTTPTGCLFAPQTAITHGNAFDATEFKEMGEKGMKLVWSPRSNVSLYGNAPNATTNIPLARSFGIMVALGPDWSMGGSVNMLDEMRFADEWDNAHWNNFLSPKDLFEMATINAAKTLALDDQIGSLKAGLYADLFIFSGDTAAPYDALLAAKPASVKLTMVGGRVLYGDSVFKSASLTPASCEDVQVCGASKFVCVAEANTSTKLDQTFSTIKTTLEEALLEVDAIPVDIKGHSYTFAPLAPLSTCP